MDFCLQAQVIRECLPSGTNAQFKIRGDPLRSPGGLGRRHAVKLLDIICGGWRGELVQAGTIVGGRAGHHPVSQRQSHISCRPDGEGRILIVGEAKTEDAVDRKLHSGEDRRGDRQRVLGHGNSLSHHGNVGRAADRDFVGGEGKTHHAVVDAGDREP